MNKETDISVWTCSRCGKCCNRCPGIYAPKDFLPDIEANMRDLLDKKELVFDIWDSSTLINGKIDIYFPKPPVIGRYPIPSSIVIDSVAEKLLIQEAPWPVHASWGGRCMHLEVNKEDVHVCKIYGKHPSEYIEMVECGDNRQERDKEIRVEEWIPYQDIIENFLKEYTNNEIESEE